MGDYCFVDNGQEILDPSRYARMLPYSGPRWYWKGSVKYMLDQGIVRWPDVNYTRAVSAHVPHDFFRHIFETIEQTQQNVRTRDLDNIDPQNFASDCINALLGLWAKQNSTSIA